MKTLLMLVLLVPFINLHAEVSSYPNCKAGCDESPQSPYQLVVDNTKDVLTMAQEAQAYFDQDPERYYQKIGQVVDRLVDIERFTRGVMATYASTQQFRALESEAEKALFTARIKRFAEILKRSLITTYAQALLNADGQHIETLPPDNQATDDKYARVEQKIYSSNGTAYNIQYSLRRDPGEPWKLYNVIVDGINIGNIFRNQFAYSVEKNKGDVDQAINNWSSEQHPVSNTP